MKFVKLLTAAHVGGTLRHPHEGVLHVEDDEAARLFENEAAEDVSDDFTAKQDRETPAEAISAASGDAAAPAPVHPHQAEAALAADATTKPAARKRAASQE